MKTISFYDSPRRRDNILHVETSLGIINIHVGLVDSEGRRVEHIEIIPNNYAGEPKVATDQDIRNIRMVELGEGETSAVPLWERDDIQFPRLLAEIMGAVDILESDWERLCETMDLSSSEVEEIFDRADAEWQRIKARHTKL